MTINEATSGARLCPVYRHRTSAPDILLLDRYLYSRERVLTTPGEAVAEYAGTTRLAFYASADEIENTVPVYLKSRKAGGDAYYKLSRTKEPEDGYELVGLRPWFWAFTEAASPGFKVEPVYQHAVPKDLPGYPRYFYDLHKENAYGWSEGTVAFYAVSPRAFFDRAAEKFFAEDHCPELALEATGVPGLAVAVVYRDIDPDDRSQDTTVHHGYGVRSLKTGAAVDENTIFQLASVSKPITSTIVAAVVGEGRLGWDDLVSKHVPNFALRSPGLPSTGTQTVTVADMLAHCSGLPDHAGDMLEDLGYDRATVLQQLRLLPVSPRQKHDRYTNFGFSAAAVAATLADQQTSWSALARKKLYDPLGMSRSSSHYEDFEKDDNCAVGHQRFSRYPGQWEWTVTPFQRNPDAQSPAGGVRSCVADMARWMNLQLGEGKFEGKEVVKAEALTKTHRRYRSPCSKYGLGWNVSPTGDLDHSGAFLKGAAACVNIWPALGVGIVALTNGEPIGVPEAVGRAFLYYVLGEALPHGQTLKAWLAKATQAMSTAIPAPKDMGYGTWVSDAPRELSAYCGKYTHEYYGDIEVKPDAGNSRRLKLALGIANPKVRQETEVALHMWRGDTFVYETFGENAVGLSAVEFDMCTPGSPRVRVENLHFSETNPDYSEIEPNQKESAWFSLRKTEAGS